MAEGKDWVPAEWGEAACSQRVPWRCPATPESEQGGPTAGGSRGGDPGTMEAWAGRPGLQVSESQPGPRGGEAEAHWGPQEGVGPSLVLHVLIHRFIDRWALRPRHRSGALHKAAGGWGLPWDTVLPPDCPPQAGGGPALPRGLKPPPCDEDVETVSRAPGRSNSRGAPGLPHPRRASAGRPGPPPRPLCWPCCSLRGLPPGRRCLGRWGGGVDSRCPNSPLHLML